MLKPVSLTKLVIRLIKEWQLTYHMIYLKASLNTMLRKWQNMFLYFFDVLLHFFLNQCKYLWFICRLSLFRKFIIQFWISYISKSLKVSAEQTMDMLTAFPLKGHLLILTELKRDSRKANKEVDECKEHVSIWNESDLNYTAEYCSNILTFLSLEN